MEDGGKCKSRPFVRWGNSDRVCEGKMLEKNERTFGRKNYIYKKEEGATFT